MKLKKLLLIGVIVSILPTLVSADTSDGIISTMIVALITGLGLTTMALFQRKQENN